MVGLPKSVSPPRARRSVDLGEEVGWARIKRAWQTEGSVLRWMKERVGDGRRRDIVRLVKSVSRAL